MTATATLRKYKATFILDTRDYQEPVETLVDSIKELMETVGAKVSKVENLGQHDFTHVVNKAFPAGIYVSYTFESEAPVPAAIHKRFHLDKKVNRIMIESL